MGDALILTNPTTRWAVEACARALVHRNEIRESGICGSIQRSANTGDRGLSLQLAPSWGDTSSAAVRLWGDDSVARAPESGSGQKAWSLSDGRLDASLGYGVSAFNGAWVATPNVAFGLNESGRIWRLGWRLTTLPGNERFNFVLDVEGNRVEVVDGDVPMVHGVMLRGSASW